MLKTSMSKFRNDEVAHIRFRACEKPVGQFLSYASKMTKLSDIDLGDSSAGTSDLKYLEKVPRLSRIIFSKSRMSIDDVIQFKRLSDMTTIGVGAMSGVKPLIACLPKIKNLLRLEMGRCNLDIDDLNQIAKLKSVNFLDLTAIACVNDTTMPIFIKTPTLQSFDLENCKITRASIPTFQAMKNLNALRMTDPEWTHGPDSFQTEFQNALPHVYFNWQGSLRDLPKDPSLR